MKILEHPRKSVFVSGYDSLVQIHGRTPQSARYHSTRSYEQRRRLISELLSGLKNKTVLDAGCGTGLYSEPLCAENTVVGLDLSVEMLRLASAHALDSVRGDLRALPFAKNTFDVVLAAEVLQHFRDPGAIIEESFRVTRPGGRLLFSSLNPSSLLHQVYKPFGSYTDLFLHPPDKIASLLEILGADLVKVFMLAYPLGMNWRAEGWKNNAACLATSWILTACKKQN